MDGYIAGGGFYYARYKTSKNSRNFKQALDSGTALNPVETGIKGELHTAHVYGSYYCQVFKGYFYAKHSGDYTFRGASDDNYDVYMSDDYGTATINQTPLIY